MYFAGSRIFNSRRLAVITFTRLNRIGQSADQHHLCHMGYNTHQREIATPASKVGLFIDLLAITNDP